MQFRWLSQFGGSHKQSMHCVHPKRTETPRSQFGWTAELFAVKTTAMTARQHAQWANGAASVSVQAAEGAVVAPFKQTSSSTSRELETELEQRHAIPCASSCVHQLWGELGSGCLHTATSP